jgi:hypothetical protein
MPSTQWSLKTFDTHQSFQGPAIKVEIDPTVIFGGRGTFGPVLSLPYTLPKPEEASAAVRLLWLGGWLGYGNVSDTDVRLVIPSQIIWPDNRSRLEVPLTYAQIEAIEEERRGNQVSLTVWLSGLADMGQAVVPVRSTNSGYLGIKREDWLSILRDLGAGARRLVELPDPRLRREDQRWAECLRLLDGATQFYRSGEYEPALKNCRAIVEGIPQVLCAAWDLPPQRDGQAFEGWTKEVENRLSAAWRKDPLTPVMLQTMLTGAWRWSAPAPHYGTGIPLREVITFALGLCTDLLQFAGQVLLAHPDPIVKQREEMV